LAEMSHLSVILPCSSKFIALYYQSCMTNATFSSIATLQVAKLLLQRSELFEQLFPVSFTGSTWFFDDGLGGFALSGFRGFVGFLLFGNFCLFNWFLL
jgi:hypothetical protein